VALEEERRSLVRSSFANRDEVRPLLTIIWPILIGILISPLYRVPQNIFRTIPEASTKLQPVSLGFLGVRRQVEAGRDRGGRRPTARGLDPQALANDCR